MNPAPTHLPFRPFLPACALGLLAALGPAQIGTLVLPAGTGDDPRSVVAIGNGHVAISNQVDGWQHFVNVSVPSSPVLTTSYNPPYGDQWFEAEYTSNFGGRLFTAHRGGGLNMIDVSNPSLPNAVASVPTIYHFRGMRYLRTGNGGVLYYNETNWGLNVFTVTGNGSVLTPVWNNFANATNDGNGLEIVGNALYQFGTPAVNPTTREFKAFDLTVPTAPVQSFFGMFTNQANGGHTQLRRHPAYPRMLASRWNDGLLAIDATLPFFPVTQPILPADPNILCWGSVLFPGSPFGLAYGHLLFGNLRFYWWLLLLVPPSGPVLPQNVWFMNIDTHDITVDPANGRIYVVGRDPVTQRGILWIF